MRLFLGLICVAFFIALQPVCAEQREPFVLVPESGLTFAPPKTILVLRNGAGYVERWAAKEFVEYVHRAAKSRGLLPQAYGSVPADWDGSAILYGVAGKKPFKNVDPSRMPTHGFQIRTEPKRLIIVGASEQGASNAMDWALRERVGVRWYMPTRLGEEVPVQKETTFSPMDLTLGPDIPARTSDARYYGTIWNRTPRGMNRDRMSRHIWTEIVRPTDKNKRDHPERFALTSRKEVPNKDWLLKFLWKDGTGAVRSNQVCTTHPVVLQLFVAAAMHHFRENPSSRMYSVEPNDFHDFCTCERCQSLDHRLGDGPLMNRLTYFYNEIATEVEKEFPDKRLGFYAYSSHVAPPTTIKPDPCSFQRFVFSQHRRAISIRSMMRAALPMLRGNATFSISG